MPDPTTTTETNTVDEPVTQGAVDSPGTEEGTEQQTTQEKTYTQADVDNLINIQKAKIPPKKELDAFRAWQAEQRKAADSKLDDEIRKRIEAQELENKRLRAQVEALKQGVKPDAVEDVITLAMARVSDTVTTTEAIQAVIKAYPAFSSADSAQDSQKQPAIVVQQDNKPIATGGINAAMNDIIRGKKGN